MKVYLATKLFSFFDRLVSVQMYNAVRASSFFSEGTVYLPFRDSNMVVSDYGNVAKNIFDADVTSLLSMDYLICRVDGLSLDAGIGFEIGYCFAKHIPTCIFNTDFINSRINDYSYLISPISNIISNCFRYEYCVMKDMTYEEELNYNTKVFSDYVRTKLDHGFSEKIELSDILNNRTLSCDVFIDICGCQYEWNSIILQKILPELNALKLSYHVSNRYSGTYSFEDDISYLTRAKVYIVCLDENEPNFDSSIFTGYAYAMNKYIIGYESNNVIYYVEGKQEMGVNLMLEQACNVTTNTVTHIVSCVRSALYDE